MKQIFSFLLLIGSINLWSQTSQRMVVNDIGQTFQVSIQSGDNQFQPGHVNDINTNALRHFLKTFEDAENVVWRIGKTGTTARLTWDNQTVTCYYNDLGNHLYSIKIYLESELDPEVADFVKSETGKSYTIYLVTEKETANGSLFEISLQNAKYWCKIRFVREADGSFEKVSDNVVFRKG